jgi:hypothetical protein
VREADGQRAKHRGEYRQGQDDNCCFAHCALLWVYRTQAIGSSGGNGTASVGVNFSSHSQYPCQ